MNAEQPTAGRSRARTFELLWGTRAAPSRGPRPSLSVERIVERAIALADAEGIAAVSMRRVAEELGVTTMSLYRYIPGKDDLLELMLDTGGGAIPPRSETPAHWRDALAWMAREISTVFRRRPWLLQIPITGAPMGPNNVAMMDRALDVMSATGLSAEEILDCLLVVSGHARNEAIIATGVETAGRDTGEHWEDVEADYWRNLVDLSTTGDYPGLAFMARAEATEVPLPDPGTGFDSGFEFGLARILDGIELFVERRAAEAARRDETRDVTRCPVCGTPVEQPATGRRRVYCSRACQQRAHRSRSAP